ncbi:hypothetical protein KIN20_029729 [Parelaphostrongylus tenuis]|uniref:C2H2-type domain-containing protein n=1 Tax=Parelaphostrongylus tenuis TaxID=148309 RepID=A0AAD5WFU5_PARTN|nr:hypothetical protein KIN20_029729 [Parelaphostrongylus tenuis]
MRKLIAESYGHQGRKRSQVFSRPSELQRHSVIHSEVRPKWKCDECENEYSHKSGLESHKKNVHKDPMRTLVACKLCSQTFHKQSNLFRHIKSQHPLEIEKPVLDCPECSCVFASRRTLTRHRRFNLKSTLKLHMEIHSRKDVDDPILTNPKCPVCMKHLSSRSALRKHMLIHECNYECFINFLTLHRLDKHRCVPQTVPHEEVDGQLTELPVSSTKHPYTEVRQPAKNYHCQLCPNSFYSFRAYKEHCSQHQGLRPHLCWTCHKSFRTTELLELHKEVHNLTKHTGVELTDRTCGAASVQSFPELTGRELAEGLFRTRAQSVDRNDLDFSIGSKLPTHCKYLRGLSISVKKDDLGDLVIPEDRAVRCEVCKHLYDSMSHLVNHWIGCGFDRDHSFCVVACPLCGHSLNGVTVGVEHMREHHPHILSGVERSEEVIEQRGENSFTEVNEDFEFSESPMKTIEPERRHKCQTCGSSFKKPSDLVRHIRVHTGERPYSCDICQRSFRVASSLYAHVRTHTRSQAEHPCRICGAEFFSKSSLALHLRIHNGEKPLQCKDCDATFRTSAARRQHEITWHEAPGGHKCKRFPCHYCSASKRKRLREQNGAEQVLMSSSDSAASAPSMDPPDKVRTLLPVKQVPATNIRNAPINSIQPKQFIETAAQISSLPAKPIKTSSGSAFSALAKMAPNEPSEVEFFITARRISHIEYSVTFSKLKPKSIRSKVDTTICLSASLLLDSASKNASLQLTLGDSQILSVSCAGVVKALQSGDFVVMRARPADPDCPSVVELLTSPEAVEFIRRCDICEVDLNTKEASDAHFLSEDHETAQLTIPLPMAVHNSLENSMLPMATMPLQRKDERTDFTCKLCGRKFLDMEPLVAHIRLEHERDHPQGITRPVARTAPIH